MKQLFYLLTSVLILSGCKQASVQPVNIIPQPLSIHISEGSINWNNINAISSPDEYSAVVNTFLEEVKGMNLNTPVLSPQETDKNIIKIISSPKLPAEGYELIITPKIITIKTSSKKFKTAVTF